MGGAQSCSELKQIAGPKPIKSNILSGVSISTSQTCSSGNCSKCQPGDDRGKCCDPCSLIIPANVSSSAAVLTKMTTDALEEKCPSGWIKRSGRNESNNTDGYCVSKSDGNQKVNYGKGIFGKSTKLLITPSIPFPVSFNGNDKVINNLSLYWPSPVRIENVQHDAILSLGDASMGDKFIILVPLISSGIVNDSGSFVGKLTPYISQVLSDSRPDVKLKADVVTGADWNLTKIIQVGSNSKVKIPYYTWESVEYLPVDKTTSLDKGACIQRLGWKKADNPTTYILLTEPIGISPTDLAAIKLLPPTDPKIAIDSLGPILYQNAPPKDCKTCKTPLTFPPEPAVSTDMYWNIFGIVVAVVLFSVAIYYGAKFALEKDWRSIYTKIGNALGKPFEAAASGRGTGITIRTPVVETGPIPTVEKIATTTATGPTGTVEQIITSTQTGPTGPISTADQITREIEPGAGVGLDEITSRPRADTEILPEITTTGPLENVLAPAAQRKRTQRQPRLKREVGSRTLIPKITNFTMSNQPTAEEIARGKAERQEQQRKISREAERKRTVKAQPKKEVNRLLGQYKTPVISSSALRKRSQERKRLPENIRRNIPGFEDISPTPIKEQPDTFTGVNPMKKSQGLLSRSKVQLEEMKKEQERIKKNFEENQNKLVSSTTTAEQRQKKLEDAQRKQAEMRQALKDRPIVKKRNVDLSGGKRRRRLRRVQ